MKSMTMQVKTQIHEESKLWSTSWPFANQRCKEENQRKKSNNQQFCMAVRNFAHHAKPLEAAKDFAHHAKFHTICEIFPCTDSIRFLSSDILYNFLVSPCKQPKYFLLYLFIYLLGSLYIR